MKKNGNVALVEELCKTINYHHTEAMQNLQELLKAYEQLPDEYVHMRVHNIAMVNETMHTLNLAYKGKKWQEDPQEEGKLRCALHKGTAISGIG